MLLVPFQIQFHELGHAIPAWLSGRAALPLPFGFTFFREEPSAFTTACLFFLIAVFAYRRAARIGRVVVTSRPSRRMLSALVDGEAWQAWRAKETTRVSTKARMRRGFLPVLAALFLGAPVARLASVASAQGAAGSAPASAAREQNVLGPGLYVFQTRIDHATCGDADRTGDVTSYYAAIDGIPGSREMRMGLLNSRFWPTWTLAITESEHVIGDAQQDGVTGPTRGVSHFDVALDHGSFKGRGTREYSRVVGAETVRCRVSYDALLRRIDR